MGYYYNRRTSYQKQENSHRTSTPSFPRATMFQERKNAWEKQFGMQWKHFLSTKKYINTSDFSKVMGWDDKACKDSFRRAEKLFWFSIMKSNLACKTQAMQDCDPDMYIDEVDWNVGIDVGLELDWEMARKEAKERWKDAEKEEVMEIFCVCKEKIVPTGWDVDDYADWQKPRMLTGMIVGG